MAQLLREFFEFKIDDKTRAMLKESIHNDGPVYLEGVIQRADAKNQNNRIYPYEILKKQCDKYINEFVASGRALGELDHADSPVIEIKNVSHVIESLDWDGKDVRGRVRLLNTPNGLIAKSLVSEGIGLGISSRGLGSTSRNSEKDADVVQEDLQLICFDLVATPSTHNAYLKLTESKEIKNFNPRKILPSSMRITQTLNELLKKG